MEKAIGNPLFQEIMVLTGLPKNHISEELVAILEEVGASPESVTLEDLRNAMAAYLMQVIGPELDDSTQEPSDHS
jgi:hypothetical protein